MLGLLKQTRYPAQVISFGHKMIPTLHRSADGLLMEQMTTYQKGYKKMRLRRNKNILLNRLNATSADVSLCLDRINILHPFPLFLKERCL